MPASMITACVALSPKVTGSRPTSVPTRQPRNAYQRLSSWKAMPNPCARLIRVFSTNGVLEAIFRKGRLEPVHERNVSEQDDGDAVNAGAYWIAPLDHNQQRDHHQEHSDSEAEMLIERDRDGGDAGDHHGMLAVSPAQFGEWTAFPRTQNQYQAENDGQRGDDHRQEAGTGHG